MVEAKAARLESQLTDSFAQIQGYAIDIKSIVFAALTNGRRWFWYFKGPDHSLVEEPFLEVDSLSPIPDNKAAVWLSLLSEGLEKKSTLVAAQRLLTKTKLNAWLLNSLSDPDENFLKYVCKQIGLPTGKSFLAQYKRDWKESVQSAIDSIYQQRGTKPERLIGTEKRTTLREPATKKSQGNRLSEKKFTSAFLRANSLVRFPDSSIRHWKLPRDLYKFVFDWCCEKHRFGTDDFCNRARNQVKTPDDCPSFLATPEEIQAQGVGLTRYPFEVFGYRLFVPRRNKFKPLYLRSLLGLCVLPSGESPQIGRELEIHIPNSDLQFTEH